MFPFTGEAHAEAPPVSSPSGLGAAKSMRRASWLAGRPARRAGGRWRPGRAGRGRAARAPGRATRPGPPASGPVMVTCRNGACASATPGEAPPNATTRQGCCEASIASMISSRRVHLARLELCGGRRRDLDALAVQQLRARGPARGQVGRCGPLVGGGPARGSGADLDQAGPGPEAGQQHRRVLCPAAEGEVTTTTAPGAPRRPAPPAPAGSRRPRARASAAHMSGSHPTVSALLSWPADPGRGLRPHGPGGPARPGGRRGVRTGRRSRPGRRPADLDDAHHGRGRDHHADGQDQRQPRVAQPGRPAPGPQADAWSPVPGPMTEPRAASYGRPDSPPAGSANRPTASQSRSSPTAGLSGTAEHTPSPLSTGMPDCIRGATVRMRYHPASRAKTTTLLR